jgi:hypothetical protein
MTIYYCMPPEDGLRTEICSGSNDRGKEELFEWGFRILLILNLFPYGVLKQRKN